MNRAAMLAPFAEEELRQFKGRGSKIMTFIEDETVMDRLDAGYGPGNWQVHVEAQGTDGAVKVQLGVLEPHGWVWHEDFGYPNQSDGETLKEAVSDGIRRCGRYVGIARDLYRKATYEPGGALGPAGPKQDGGLVNEQPESFSDEQVELLGNLQKTGKAMKGGADKYQGEWWQQPGGHAIGFRLKLDGDDRDIPQVLINGVIGEALFLLGDKPLIGQQVTVKGKLYNVRPAPPRRSFYRLIVGEHPDSDFIETADARIPAAADAPSAPIWPDITPEEASEIEARERAEATA